MKRLIIGGVATSLLAVAGCAWQSQEPVEDATEANVTSRDWIEGAYVKQGGTPLHFVFFRGAEGEQDDSYFGEIEKGGKAYRAAGKFDVGRDKFGTVIKLKLEDKDTSPTMKELADADKAAAGGTDAAPTKDATPDTCAAPSDNTLVEQAFSGSMHFLKIGQNDTILVRGDANCKTAHYKRVKSWCGKKGAKDCSASVQNTGLECQSRSCTTKHECACK
jgi:hypothetical protein